MPLSFPLSVAGFMDILPVKDMTFELTEAVETEETAGGEILTAELGTRLWQGEISLADMLPDEADHALAMLDLLRRAGASFLCHDRARPWPRADWQGASLTGFNPVLHSVAANARELRLGGLPPGYALSRRDALAFSYGTNPARFALHRLVGPTAADGSGLTPLVEVVPNLRPGWSAGAVVQLVKPACKAIVVPKSFQPGRRKARMTTGVSFRWQQTLR